MEQILIVEDDVNIGNLIQLNLELVGYKSHLCVNGTQMKQELENKKYDLILLDVMLPGASGFELISACKNIPVIFVTAKGELNDKLQGLTLGAEDYIVKPFEMMELVARVKVVLRRFHKEEEMFSLDGVTVDQENRTVEKDGKRIELTPREFNLLSVLIDNRNIAMSREKLLEVAWGWDYEGETKTVDVHIQRLRKKLGWDKQIQTVNKVGYRLEVKTT
ncbi:MAG: response regulator transcription factor [Lachnospiraceae bacterium]|nr:response regulator transcription factor [Lachnospiraceae bacterium]